MRVAVARAIQAMFNNIAMPALPKLCIGFTHLASDENPDEPGHRRRKYTTPPLLASDVFAVGMI
jgi:hypothetical protein